MSSNNDDDSPQHHTNPSPTVSYVYPVRSLLSGIQPAAATRTPSDKPTQPETPASISSQESTAGSLGSPSPSDLPSPPKPDPDISEPADTPRLQASSTAPTSSHRAKRSKPNFRDFPTDQSPFSPRTFSTALPAASSGSEGGPGPDVLFTSGPTGESVVYTHGADGGVSDDHYNPRHPPHLSELAADAFAEVTSRSTLIPEAIADDGVPTTDVSDGDVDPTPSTTSEYANVAPTNFSQSGIVHLPPLEDRSDNQSGSRSRSGGPSISRRFNPDSQYVSQFRAHSDSGSSEPQRREPVPPASWDTDSPGLSTDLSRSSSIQPSSSPVSRSDSKGSGISPPGVHMSVRYEHVEDENGHHLIVGREGKLTKCEDEPIRTPGAVQGFGVLVAVEEDNETGNLVVRQVSENSTELLGFSPSYLFGLECFSQTFLDHQADILFDNIQYLSDTSLMPEEQAENLHVFMLSGWGEPGSASPEEIKHGRLDPRARRTWTCWCAAHRPQMAAPAKLESDEAGQDTTYQNIIILEFELERDSFNPLYPPPISPESGSAQSGVSSPSASVSVSASNSSGSTLVSHSEDVSVATPEDSTYSVPSTLNENEGSAAAVSLPTLSPILSTMGQAHTVPGEEGYMPSTEDVLESTTSRSRPLLALERLRRTRRPGNSEAFSPESQGSGGQPRGNGFRRRRGNGAVGMMDVFAVIAQINEQLGAAQDLDTFLKVTAGVMKDLTQFHRVLVYQFDEVWNGQVVSELVDWGQTHDLYRGLHFPASDIPAQARELYALNKVRLLYDRELPTARLVVRSKEDLDTPLDMTHCYLRAMSPIHLKYLGNMGIRASMSVSIIAFGTLWGLVACHSYGPHGMRVSFPVRQMLRLLSQSISRNIERLSYAQRLHTRKLINTMPSDQHPSGYIVSNADDLLGLFDADYGVLVIGEGAKILGPNLHGQEILIVAEYLRLKQFGTLQVSQAVTVDYPDLQLTNGLEIIAGLLYVPLSVGGRDFIAFLRKGQPRKVNWAGRPYKRNESGGRSRSVLEPRASFKAWSETVAGRCRAWTDEHLETAGVLALVYGKFIEVWRQKESALQTTKLTNILLSNASHEVRTPLNHIINYLELAMNGPLDTETRENLSQSHAASKSLLFTINDLLDLTRLESGNETSFNEPFDLRYAIKDATQLYLNEAVRRGLHFSLELENCPRQVIGDSKKIRTVVANLTANALKYTTKGQITVMCQYFDEPMGLRNSGDVAVEIVVSDTGCGIPTEKLESIFREFEQVESTSRQHSPGLGLGLAVVARIVEQLGGQLRVDSAINKGSRFSFLLPLTTGSSNSGGLTLSAPDSSSSSLVRPTSSVCSRPNSSPAHSEIDSIVEALSSSHMDDTKAITGPSEPRQLERASPPRVPDAGKVNIRGSGTPLKPVKVDEFDLDSPIKVPEPKIEPTEPPRAKQSILRSPGQNRSQSEGGYIPKLRVLIVEDNDINRMILAKRLSLDGHTIVNTTNGQEGLDMVKSDRDFDCVLMDIQMPLLNGYEATERIRAFEKHVDLTDRLSHKLNGRIPIFAVSASLLESQRDELHRLGMDGWILKPIDFKRLRVIMRGVIDWSQREKDVYQPGGNWEAGGWLSRPSSKPE